MPLKHPMSLKTSPNHVCIFCHHGNAALFVCIYIIQWMEIINWYVLITWLAMTIGVLFYGLHSCCCFLCHHPWLCCICTSYYASVCFLFSCLFGTLLLVSELNQYFKLIKFSAMVSGIPNSACPFPGTTKKHAFFVTFLNLIWTMHMPNCVMCVQLYVFNLMFPFTDLFSLSSPMFANNFSKYGIVA